MSTADQDHKLPLVDPQGSGANDGSSIQPPPITNGVNSPVNPATQAQNIVSGVDSSMPADDLDLIEKAWVEKAKTIVKKTQGDPHAQNELMSKMKADYMKKRYNRDIKVSE